MIKEVQDSVEGFGGVIVQRFSQSQPPVSSLIGAHEGTRQGICRALCVQWMIYSIGKKNFWGWMMPKGELSPSAISGMMTNQVDHPKQMSFAMTVRGRMGPTLQNLGDLVSNGASYQNLKAGKGPCQLLGAVLALTKNTQPVCVYIAIEREDRATGYHGHGVAGYLDSGVTFFDPNFGEFRFDARADFSKWCKECFGPKSGYDQRYTGIRFIFYEKIAGLGLGRARAGCMAPLPIPGVAT